MNDFLQTIFNLLNENKKLPYYQAERRIDIFINFFLEDIIRQHTIFTDAIYVAAEFPLKKAEKSDHAAHIDYLMYSKIHNRMLFVELKTDNRSFKEDQISFYDSDNQFLSWYQKMNLIKMKKFDHKKRELINVIEQKVGDITDKMLVEAVILQPSIDATLRNSKWHYVELNHLTIKTEFQEEWDLFEKWVLSRL